LCACVPRSLCFPTSAHTTAVRCTVAHSLLDSSGAARRTVRFCSFIHFFIVWTVGYIVFIALRCVLLPGLQRPSRFCLSLCQHCPTLFFLFIGYVGSPFSLSSLCLAPFLAPTVCLFVLFCCPSSLFGVTVVTPFFSALNPSQHPRFGRR